jgi:predicted DNA-binding transcriptional regulator YafY
LRVVYYGIRETRFEMSKSRPPLRRLHVLHGKLRRGERFTCEQVAAEVEANPRTVQRDLEYLRDQLGAPVEYDRAGHTWVYTDSSFELPDVIMTEGELLALLVADRVLCDTPATPMTRRLHSVLAKLTRHLPERVSVDLRDVGSHWSVRGLEVAPVDPAVFRAVNRALHGRRRLLIEHRGEAGITSRRVDPLHVLFSRGEAYVYVFCHLRQDLRLFKLARILRAGPTGERFVPPAGIDAKARAEAALASSFGVMAGEEPQRVHLRFNAEAARYVREKTWHATQELEVLPGGGCEVAFTLTSFVEFLPWVLQWGDRVEVLEPASLRAEVAAVAGRMQKKHEGPTP